jgi:hypothetical protein
MADLAGMPIASPFSCCGAAKMCGRRCFLRVSEIFESQAGFWNICSAEEDVPRLGHLKRRTSLPAGAAPV